MPYTLLTITKVFCLHICVNYKESLRRTPRSTNGWFSWSCQALQQAIPLSCSDRKEGKMKTTLQTPFSFFKKSFLPPHNKLYFEKLDKKTLLLVFFKIVWRINCTIICDISELGGWHSLLLPPGAKSSGSCLTEEGPRPRFYGLPEGLRTFLAILNKRDSTYSLSQFLGRSGHLQWFRWYQKGHKPRVCASRCPGDSVRAFPTLHTACIHYREWREGFSSIGNRTSDVRRAEGQQHCSPYWVGWGKRASVAWSTSVFIGSNRKNSNCCLLTTGE